MNSMSIRVYPWLNSTDRLHFFMSIRIIFSFSLFLKGSTTGVEKLFLIDNVVLHLNVFKSYQTSLFYLFILLVEKVPVNLSCMDATTILS